MIIFYMPKYSLIACQIGLTKCSADRHSNEPQSEAKSPLHPITTRSSTNGNRTAQPREKYQRERQIFGSFPSPRPLPLFLWVWCGFMVGLGKLKLCTKFEVASFSHCVNIEGKPQILGSSSSPGPCPPFLLRVII